MGQRLDVCVKNRCDLRHSVLTEVDWPAKRLRGDRKVRTRQTGGRHPPNWRHVPAKMAARTRQTVGTYPPTWRPKVLKNVSLNVSEEVSKEGQLRPARSAHPSAVKQTVTYLPRKDAQDHKTRTSTHRTFISMQHFKQEQRHVHARREHRTSTEALTTDPPTWRVPRAAACAPVNA